MALNVGSLPVVGVYAGSAEVQQVYVGAVLVWESRETVTITGTRTGEAQGQLRAALADRGLDYTTVTEIPFALDTSNVTDMYSMFEDCAKLTSVPQMNTSNVTTMRNMFKNCSSLTSAPDMDTSNVTDMNSMFNRCPSLTSVPDIDTSQVTNMYAMFYDCGALTSVPDMNTSNVTDMAYMFYGCGALTSAPNMDTSKVTNMHDMFNRCSSLTSVPDMNTRKVTDMFYMFYGCTALTSVELHGLGPSLPNGHVLDLSETALTSAGATALFDSLGTVASGRTVTLKLPDSALDARQGVARSKGWTVTPFVDEAVITGTSSTEARDSFRAALAARGLDYRTVKTVPFFLNTSNVTSMYGMFSGCSSLTSVPSMDTSNVTSMYGMFSDCTALTSVPDMDTGNVTNMTSMFFRCSSLTSVPSMDTSNVTDMQYMFYSCSSLTSVPDINTSNVTNTSGMFSDCTALTDGNVRCIGKKSGVKTGNMIANSSLTRLPFYNANGNWTG